MAFHAVEGLHFARLADGAVEVSLRKPVLDGLGVWAYDETAWSVVLEAGTWCSAVASVSHRGENAERWQRAVRFHG